MISKDLRRKAASYLLASKAVNFNLEKPYVWASGWNSPMYCDNRVTLSYPLYRSFFKEQLISLIKEYYPEVEAIAGVATAGIPQGALVADALNLPFLYVRPKAKSHGLANQIEGKLDRGKSVVLVEDLISTGGSAIKAAEALRQAEAKVLGIITNFTYGFPTAEQNLAQAKLEALAVTDYDYLIEVAESEKLVASEHLASLREWRESPSTWTGAA